MKFQKCWGNSIALNIMESLTFRTVIIKRIFMQNCIFDRKWLQLTIVENAQSLVILHVLINLIYIAKWKNHFNVLIPEDVRDDTRK